MRVKWRGVEGTEHRASCELSVVWIWRLSTVRRRRERLSAARWSPGPERRENKTEGCDYAREKIGFGLAFVWTADIY
jgi:hypothetical protein